MGKKKKNKNVDMFAFNAGTSKTDKNKKTRKSKKDKKRPLDRAFDKTILQMTGEELAAFLEYLFECVIPHHTDNNVLNNMCDGLTERMIHYLAHSGQLKFPGSETSSAQDVINAVINTKNNNGGSDNAAEVAN